MKYLLAMLGLLLFAGCTTEETIVYEIVTDDDRAEFVVGHVEVIFDFAAIDGKGIIVRNGNDRAIAVQITSADNDAAVIFSDSWIGGGEHVAAEATFSDGEELRVRIAIYKAASDIFRDLIETLTGGFWGRLNEVWIEEEYEQIIRIYRG